MLCLKFQIFDPLEQFQKTVVQTGQLSCALNYTNSLLSYTVLSIIVFGVLYTISINQFKNNVFLYLFTETESFLKNLIQDNSRTIKKTHLLSFLFLFISLATINLSGLIPYSWTVTSWFTPVLLLGFSFLYQINILLILKKKYFFFSQFVPAGTPLVIIPFLTIIELISYTSRVVSLSVRLFANMLSGHALLKILISFSWSLVKAATFVSLFIALVIWCGVTAIFLLEIMVALLQAYVFTLLLNIYYSDIFADEH